jgi:hypothetical protein
MLLVAVAQDTRARWLGVRLEARGARLSDDWGVSFNRVTF